MDFVIHPLNVINAAQKDFLGDG